MKLQIKLVLVAVAFIALRANASCTQAAVMGAPTIPSLSESSFQQVAAVRTSVEEYIDKAQQRLERCGDERANPDYNIAIKRLDITAARFNVLAAHYNNTVMITSR